MQYTIKEKSDIDLLVENNVHEGLAIDYKEELPDLEKKKLGFLKDICLFGNAHGGQIIYGIKETKGLPASIVGVTIDNFDGVLI